MPWNYLGRIEIPVKLNMSVLVKSELPVHSIASRAGGSCGKTCGKGQAYLICRLQLEQTLILEPHSGGTPVPCDGITPTDLCGSRYPASHIELMRSLCALAAVVTNKSSLVSQGLGSTNCFIDLELCSTTAADKHIRKTVEKAYGPAKP